MTTTYSAIFAENDGWIVGWVNELPGAIAQEHFIDLCRMLGHDTPGDSRDGSLAFEAGVDKQKDGQGWADVWKRAPSPGSTRARMPTWPKPTSRSSSTASRSRTRRC